jgi:hypothetical protein
MLFLQFLVLVTSERSRGDRQQDCKEDGGRGWQGGSRVEGWSNRLLAISNGQRWWRNPPEGI